MHLLPAQQNDARQIGEIYRQAFPSSVEFFFPRKSREKLLELLELSFALSFALGAEGVIAYDQGRVPAGYCLYLRQQKTRQLKNVLTILPQIVGLLTLSELSKLAHNQLVMNISVRKNKKVPKPQAQILSLAVLPDYQGQGVGTQVLDYALGKLKNQSIGLNVRAHNSAGKRLYTNAGFVQYGQTKDLSGWWLMLQKPV